MNVTAFVLGMIVTLGYYFCVVRKKQKEFLEKSRNNEVGNGILTDIPDSKK